MIAATVYIIACSARNRMARRLRRLTEARYLLGAIAGGSYLVFTLFIRERAFGRGSGTAAASGSLFGVGGLAGSGVLLACAALVSWVLPFGSGLLEFSRAETAFLFQSPVSRRQLVIYRLMRSQFAVFTGALIIALAYPTGSLFTRTRSLAGMWLLLMTSHVFFTGVTLARERLRRRGQPPLFMWPALVWPVVTVIAVFGTVFSGAAARPIQTIWDATEAIITSAQQGIAVLLLSPFTLLTRPLFARTASEFIASIGGAFAMYIVAVLWLLWADGQSLDAADAIVERQVTQGARRARSYVARDVRWMPRPGASPELLFVWKGVLQTFRTVDRRVLFRLFLILGWMIAASVVVTRARGLVALVGVFSTWGALFTIFMAPQIIRMDMRQDLEHLELLKTWPVRGASIVRGEIIWPAAIVTTIAWVFGLVAMVLSLVSASLIPTANRVAVWASLLVVTPAVVLAQYTIHNAVAVLFPAWVPLGASRLRGVDAVGQRLILLAANWFGIIVALLPGVVLAAVLSALLRHILGPWVILLGAALTLAIAVGEAWLVTEMLGPVYERMDVTSVERAE